MGHSVDEFFKDIEKSSDEGKLLPNWWVLFLIAASPLKFGLVAGRHGELYLEVCSLRKILVIATDL